MFKTNLFQDHVAFVTGGGSGLGLAMASRLVGLGARVALVGRRQHVLDEAVRALGSGSALALRCDIRYADEVDEAVARALAHFGHIDSLLNSAAGNFVSPTERLSNNAFKLVVDTVLMGTVHCTLALGKHWISAGQAGCMLSIVTNYASTGSAYVVPSACAKAGVENLIKSLAAEWGRYGIRLVGISPGPFPTAGAMGQLRIHEDILPGVDIPAMIAARIPLGRLGKIEELADLAAFLLSPNAAYITGEIVRIDGGEMPNMAGEFSFLHDVPKQVWDAEAGRLKRGHGTLGAVAKAQ
ncbi:NAD(P)-dependent dehydrogenase (short-subunit alcohol dehydrogenase family) [Oxalobacteraceae bacterium GrIS 1.11]